MCIHTVTVKFCSLVEKIIEAKPTHTHTHQAKKQRDHIHTDSRLNKKFFFICAHRKCSAFEMHENTQMKEKLKTLKSKSKNRRAGTSNTKVKRKNDKCKTNSNEFTDTQTHNLAYRAIDWHAHSRIHIHLGRAQVIILLHFY